MFKKSLVCVMCEPRASHLSWPSFKRNVLDALDADLALCVGVRDDFDYSSPMWQHAKYRFVSREYADWGEALDRVQAHVLAARGVDGPPPNWRSTTNIEGTWLSGLAKEGTMAGSGAIQHFFRWLLLDQLKAEGLADRYDHFICTRSDLVWMTPHPPVEMLDADRVWVPDGEHYGGVCDRHVVLSRATLNAGLNQLEWLLLDPDSVRRAFDGESEANSETFFKLHLGHCKAKLGTFPFVAYIAREANTRNAWAQGVWSDERGHEVGYPTEQMLVDRYSSYFPDEASWRSYLAPGQRDLLLGRMLMTAGGKVVRLAGDRLTVERRDGIVPRRHVVRVDAIGNRIAPFLVDPDIAVTKAAPLLAGLTIARWRDDGSADIGLPDGRYLAVDDRDTVVAADAPTPFILARWEDVPAGV